MIKLPFFPMRPTLGRAIVPGREEEVLSLLETHVAQLKLNGDRACVANFDGTVRIQNRHGSWFKNSVDLRPFQLLPRGFCLDGEVYQKKFHPFEALAIDGVSLLAKPVEERIEQARYFCEGARLPWAWDFPGIEWLRCAAKAAKHEKIPVYEGLVFKRRGSKYVLSGSADSPSQYWTKCKF
jgi:ATP-dependent DNA ligase